MTDRIVWQDLAVEVESSGWGERFVDLANRGDRALKATEPVVGVTFDCAVCGRQAGELALHGLAARAELRRVSFTGTLQSPVSGEAFELLHAALAEGHAEAVFQLDAEYAPFYCPTCAARTAATIGIGGTSSTMSPRTGMTPSGAVALTVTRECWRTDRD